MQDADTTEQPRCTGDTGGDAGPGSMLRDVRTGLSGQQKSLSPKYFYDHRGSRLFEEITRLPEYYLTRTEQGLLEEWVPHWFAAHHPASLVELGAGSARKTGILLDAMVASGAGRRFVPLDVSEEFLRETAARVRADYPELEVTPRTADITDPLELAPDLPRPTLFALLGSTLGNFVPDAAVELLGHVRDAMTPGDLFLMGADLRPGPEKSVERLEAAYDDDAGVTAEFNLNVLRVLNRELGADFDLDSFRHRAFYDPENGWIEMHLVARGPQQVHLPGGPPIRFADGESVRTEISAKYDRPVLDGLLGRADLEVRAWEEDDDGLYALVLAGPA